LPMLGDAKYRDSDSAPARMGKDNYYTQSQE